MSIYGPKLKLPKMSLPNISFDIPKPDTKTISIIIIIIIALATIFFLLSDPFGMGGNVRVSWKNNPLDLRDNVQSMAELTITLTNNSSETKNITLDVVTESEELLVFCPDKNFPNVAPNTSRITKCVIRRNPSEKIFSGTYKLNIKSNIGETQTILEIMR